MHKSIKQKTLDDDGRRRNITRIIAKGGNLHTATYTKRYSEAYDQRDK